MQQGYVKLYRSLMESPVWVNLTPWQKVVMVTLLMLVCWKPAKYNYYGTDVIVEPGQFICSQKQLEKACGKGITRQMVRSTLKKLEMLNFLTISQPQANHDSTTSQPQANHESTKQLTKVPTNGEKLITLVNWAKYQGADDKATNELTKQSTIGQPLVNHESTTGQPQVNHEATNIKEELTTKNKELRIKKNKTSSAKITDLLKKFCGENAELMAALTGWVEMRKKIKKPLTDRAVNLNLKKLYKLSKGNEQAMIEIVNQSTMNSWQGFFPLKDADSKRERLARMFEEVNRREEVANDTQPENTDWAYVPF